MYKIYLLKDINGLCYIGKTKQKLKHRLSLHRHDKKRGRYCSSSKINLDNCQMIILEECEKDIASEREQYWMERYTLRVNQKNATRSNKQRLEYDKKYYFDNKDKVKQYNIDNKEKIKEYNKHYQKQYREYQNTWGGDIRYDNNLLNIAIDLFSI